MVLYLSLIFTNAVTCLKVWGFLFGPKSNFRNITPTPEQTKSQVFKIAKTEYLPDLNTISHIHGIRLSSIFQNNLTDISDV